MGDWLCLVGTTSSLLLDFEGFLGFAGFFVLVTGPCLGHNMSLGADFPVLQILLVFVNSLHVVVK
jgi:hypothetical protein